MRYLIVLLILSGCATAPQELDADIQAPLTAEAKAYSAALSEKMDRGELSEAEARSLYTQKVNELTERALAAHRARYPAAQPSPQVTQCRSDGYGGVRCTTR